MRTVILRPRPLPAERAQTPVLLLVVALHVGLLWLASAYWPLKTVLQSAANSFTVQVLQRSAERLAAAVGADATTTNRPQAISQPARQRLGRAEQMLNLPVPATESSTPLAGTAQTAQATPARPAAAAPAEPPAPSTPTPSTPILSTAIRSTTASLAVPAPAAAMPAMPTPVTPAAANPVASPETSSPQAQPQVLSAPPAKSAPQALPSPEPAAAAAQTPPPTAPPLPVTAAAAAAATAAPAAAVATVRPELAAASSATPANVVGNPGTATATATATSAGAAPAAGSGSTSTGAVGVERGATPAQPAPGASAPLNLAVPPRYLYRPPVAVPGRSLAEMANEQLRRKPRDAFAEGIQDAGSIDCLKDAPGGSDSAAQGLLAIGPLLKRAIEEKCRK